MFNLQAVMSSPVAVDVDAEIAGRVLAAGAAHAVDEVTPGGSQRAHEEVGVGGHEEVDDRHGGGGLGAQAFEVGGHGGAARLPADVGVVEVPALILLGGVNHFLCTGGSLPWLDPLGHQWVGH